MHKHTLSLVKLAHFYAVNTVQAGRSK